MRAREFIRQEDYHPNDRPPGPESKPTMPAGTVRVDVSDVYDWYKLGQHISNLKGLGKHDFGKGPPSTIFSFGDENTEHKYIQDLERTGLTTTDIDPVDPNQPAGMKRQKTDPTYNVDEVAGAVLKATDLVNVFIRGTHKGQTVTKLIAKDFPNNRIPQLMQKLEQEHGINPGAVVYGLSKKVDEARRKKKRKKVRRAYGGYFFPGYSFFGGDASGEGGGDGGGESVGENFADGKVKGKSRPGRVKRAGASCDGSVSELRARAKKYGGEKGKMYHWCANMKGGKK
jgi:hypothetical protein